MKGLGPKAGGVSGWSLIWAYLFIGIAGVTGFTHFATKLLHLTGAKGYLSHPWITLFALCVGAAWLLAYMDIGRKPRVDRSPEEKWQIVQEGIKSGNVSETCRRHGIAPNLFYRWKDEAEQGAKAALGGRSAAAAETEKDHRIRQLERTLGRKSLEIEILKNVVGE